MSREALVVGINIYDYAKFGELKAPVNDAEAIASRLQEQGDFRVKSLLAKNPFPVVTVKQLEEAVENLFYPDGESYPDTALFYFSGHGYRRGRAVKEGFLVTTDANPDERNYGLSLKWLRELLQNSPVRQQIVWLDCCYAGEVYNFIANELGDRSGKTRCFIAASREYEPAYETKNGSILTQAIIKGFDAVTLKS